MSSIFSSFSKKSTILFLLVGLIPVVFIGSIFYLDKINHETKDLEEKLETFSIIGANNIENWINTKIISIQSIANDDLIISNTKKLSLFDERTSSFFESQFILERQTNNALHNFEWVEEIIIYDIDGNLLFYNDLEPPVIDHPSKSYFFDSLQGDTSLSNIFPSIEPIQTVDRKYAVGVPTMFISTPIMGEVGLEGILIARINSQSLLNSFQEQSTDLNKFDSYMVNSEGTVISNSKTHEFFTNILSHQLDFPYALQDSFNTIFSDALLSGYSKSFQGYKNVNGDTVLGEIRHIPNTDWYYVLEVDKESAFESINYLQIILISSISLFAIAITLVAMFFAGSLSKPIKKLQIAAEKISGGDRTVSVPITGDKELADLGKSITEMIDSLLKSESKIRSTEKKYRNLYEKAPEMYRTVDNNGKLIDCNVAYCEKLGYSKEEILGKSLFDFVPDSHKETMNDIFSSWKLRGDVRNREVMLKRKDGTVFPALLSATSVHDDSGNVIGANTLIRDMSDLYNAQKEIEELRIKRLSVVGELTARIAHDLRNPLSVIKNSAEILRLTYEDKVGPSDKEQWDRLERGIYRITHQVDDVLDYIRAPPLKIEENSLSVIIQDTIERIQIPDTINIHPPTNDAIIPCDGEKLEVVFVNLIMNAIQAFEGKAGDVTIKLDDNYDSGESVLIEIIDNGPGIPNDLIEKIFEPLFTTRQIGTGLGLPSCKNIIERHDGKITVSSNSSGTTFSIVLPKHNEKFMTTKI